MRLVFNRGTVLMLDAGDFPAGDLPGVLWDSRVSAHRYPAHLHKRVRAALDAGGVRYSDECPYTGQKVDGCAPIELRPYQEAALAAWQLAGRRGVIALPTGAGKTRVALAAIARCARPTLCLVPTRVLLDQWAREIRALLGVEPGRYGDGDHVLQPITVATFESAWRHMAGIGNRFHLLVVDEAHHFGSGVKDEALEMSIAPFRLGLTATPPRDARLTTLIGPTVFELEVRELVGDWLAPFDDVVVHVELDAGERAEYESLYRTFQSVIARFRDANPGASWEEFAREAARSDEGRCALAAWRRSRALLAYPRGKREMVGALLSRHRHDRTLVFTGDNQTTYAVSRENLIMPLTCDIQRKEREAALARFRDGELRALVSSQVLNEGIDVPDADVGIVVAGARGEREHVQRIGRLLRPRKGKHAIVYELVVEDSQEVRAARKRRRSIAA